MLTLSPPAPDNVDPWQSVNDRSQGTSNAVVDASDLFRFFQ